MCVCVRVCVYVVTKHAGMQVDDSGILSTAGRHGCIVPLNQLHISCFAALAKHDLLHPMATTF